MHNFACIADKWSVSWALMESSNEMFRIHAPLLHTAIHLPGFTGYLWVPGTGRVTLEEATKVLFMFHNHAANSLHKSLVASTSPTVLPSHDTATRPHLVSAKPSRHASSALPELIAIASRRCSSFFAEAAVLVLVFGILDFFLQRGHIEIAWVAGALLISVALLATSVATDFGARRWLGAQP